MSVTSDLLEMHKQQRQEARLQRLLEIKGYSNPEDESFGLNQWTCRLTPRQSYSERESQESLIQRPDHLISFLSIPVNWDEDLIDTNSIELRSWISEYKWHQTPGINSPFSHARVRACSEGLLLPQWVHTADEGQMEVFLLIRRDGVVEFGSVQEAYFSNDRDTIFRFIKVVGRLWQYLAFVHLFNERFLPGHTGEILIIVNMRGTKGALIGNLAEGWNEPSVRAFDAYRPKCPDKHLQIQRKVSLDVLT